LSFEPGDVMTIRVCFVKKYQVLNMITLSVFLSSLRVEDIANPIKVRYEVWGKRFGVRGLG
jgi:hypothetical protein